MPDPFESLRQPDAPLRPRRAFAAELRRRLTDVMSNELVRGETVPNATRIHRVETYLSVSDPRAAIAFYGEAFGARMIDEPLIMADGRIGHCELQIGDSVVRVAGEHPIEGVLNPASLGGTTVQLYVTVDDADAVVDRAQGPAPRCFVLWRSHTAPAWEKCATRSGTTGSWSPSWPRSLRPGKPLGGLWATSL